MTTPNANYRMTAAEAPASAMMQPHRSRQGIFGFRIQGFLTYNDDARQSISISTAVTPAPGEVPIADQTRILNIRMGFETDGRWVSEYQEGYWAAATPAGLATGPKYFGPLPREEYIWGSIWLDPRVFDQALDTQWYEFGMRRPSI